MENLNAVFINDGMSRSERLIKLNQIAIQQMRILEDIGDRKFLNKQIKKYMCKDDTKGYVYILTNPSFREDWVKIGRSRRSVDVRSKELDNTAVPLPFEIYATLKTEKYEKVEKKIHKQIDRLTDLRIRPNREFFNIAPSVALDIMRDIADFIDDAELSVYVDGQPIVSKNKDEDKRINEAKEEKKRKKPKPPFKFHMVDINVGDEIVFDALNLPVKVASDDKIEYKGRLWSLSTFTTEFLPETRQSSSRSYQGPKYFSYKGKTLSALRDEKEKN